MTQTFNVEPYYDDYDKHKHFHKILFRPGYSLQTRELTQMQTILQEQIRRLGDHLFKNGTMVIPGELSLDNEFHYVKINPVFGTTAVSMYLSNLVGIIVKGGTSGVRAQVLAVSPATATDPDTIFVKYIDTTTSNKVFLPNETISPDDILLTGLNVQTIITGATGLGSSASVKEGVYYIDGYFVLCEPQLLILDKYTNTPTYSVGFNITETIVTPEVDETLLDNAQGSYNFAAPGAHRHSIVLELAKKTNLLDTADTTKYIELVSLINGAPQNVFNQTAYAELAKVMARRTYDESGDYVVKDFKYATREHRNNNRGAWAAATAYIQGDIVTHGGNSYSASTAGNSGSLGIAGTWPTDRLTEFNDGGVRWRWTDDPKYNGGLYTPEQGGLEDQFALAVEPGKAYVRGYEVEKVATSYIQIPKSRSFASVPLGSMNSEVGNYVFVTNIHGLPDINSMPIVTFYNAMTTTGGAASANGVAVGTARVRYFELHSGTIGVSTTIYKVSLFNVVMSNGYDFARDVKQLFVNTGVGTTSFTADIQPVLSPMTGTVTSSGATVTGTGTTLTNLKSNDVINIAGTLYRVTAVTNNSTISISPTLTLTVGSSFSLATTNILEPQNSNLLFPIDNYVKSARSGAGVNEIRYVATQAFSGTTDAGGSVAFTLTGAGNINTFASGSGLGNYIGVYGNGVIMDLAGKVTISNVNQTITVAFGAGVPSQAVTVIATLNKFGAVNTEKQKVLTYTFYNVTTEAVGTARVITLPKSDGDKIQSVKMRAGTWASNNPADPYAIDITERFIFDDGQTDSYYDRCKVILADGQQAPQAPFQIVYEYYEHVGSGDYFSINSYAIPYRAIPWYGEVSLRDVLDFRPRISDDGLTFTGAGSSISSMPKRGNNIGLSYDYYLARIDKLCVEPSGDFHVISGVPAIDPSAPATSSTGMLLNTISIAPYTTSPAAVVIETVDNRRYTMRDIGKLENRINNLEYYTTLSLTEQGTTNMSITDSNGLSRYKNGFIVDSFNGHGIGDASNADYRCAVDAENKILRPFHTMKNVTLYETDAANRATNNYVLTGDLITLPYSHVAVLTQAFASRFENVNPFAVYAFVGNAAINPESDDWFEGTRLPDIVTNVEGNYNNLLNQLTRSGQLGTVWNAWQNVWFGAPYVAASSQSTSVTGGVSTTANRYAPIYYGRYGARWGGGLISRTVTTTPKTTTTTTTTTMAQQIGQTRTGVNTTISPRIDVTQVGESVVSRVVIPYMRSRNVAFVLQGLKSGTQMYANFDTFAVSQYVTPATKLTLNNVNGFSNVFDAESHASSNSEHVARKIGADLDLALNKGMIVVGQTSGATAVVLFQETIVPGSTFVNLYVANVKGTFASGETVIGSLNGGTVGSRGTVASVPTVKVKGDALVTNYAGVACGVFTIPHDSAMSFRTGARELVFKDVLTGSPTTSASSVYSAVGIFTTSQASFIATRNADVVRTNVSQNGVITPSWQTVNSVSATQAGTSVTYADPLAQTFVVDSPGGMFVTKVDLFFQSKETKLSTPVRIEIREVIAGNPGNKIIPMSVVYKDPNDVVTSPTGSLATTFTFKSPVHLQDGNEYALVILSDSNNYNVFISQMGEVDIITNKMISTQPTLGVLFKSSNGSTWTSNQLQDLKFTLYRASFNTSVTGYVDFSNGPVINANLYPDPYMITNGSTLVRVSHPDHNMPVGSTVTLAGATTVGNITGAQLSGNFVISNVDPDSYTITSPVAATSSTIGGGINVTATENMLFNTFHANTSELVFQNTSIEYQIKTTTGQSVDGTETPYVKDSAYKVFTANSNVDFPTPRMIASRINETTSLAGAKSINIMATLKSTTERVSPVIDVQRLSCTAVQNKLNAPTLANTNVDAIDDRIVITGVSKIGFEVAKNAMYCLVSDTASMALLQTLTAGKYVNVSGDVTDVPTAHTANNGNFLVTGTSTDGTDFYVNFAPSTPVLGTIAPNANNTITVKQHQRFIDEIAPTSGSAYNKYISREIVLVQPSTYIKIKLAANLQPQSNLDIYYRTNPVGGSNPISTSNWILANPVKAPTRSSVPSYNDIDYDIPNLPAFDTLQVKLVMTSTSTSQVPSCKDLRIIACA